MRYVWLFVVLILSCTTRKEKISEDVVYHKVSSLNTKTALKESSIIEVKRNENFELGYEGFLDGCFLNLECDCCGGELEIMDSVFYMYYACFPASPSYKGRVYRWEENLILESDGKQTMTIYNDEFEADSVVTSVYDTLRFAFKIFQCQESILLKEHRSELVAVRIEPN